MLLSAFISLHSLGFFQFESIFEENSYLAFTALLLIVGMVTKQSFPFSEDDQATDPIFALDHEIQLLKARNSELQRMINSSKEGFLLINKLQRVIAPFSHECYRIFKQEVLGENIAQLLAKEDKSLQKFITDSFEAILSLGLEDPMMQTYTRLLPKELVIKDHWYETRYSVVSEGHLMIVLVDITEKKQFEEALKKEHLQLEFVVNALVNRQEFLDLYTNFNTFLGSLEEYKTKVSPVPYHTIYDVYRKVHTFKSHFYQAHFPLLTDCIQELETDLAKYANEEEIPIELFNLLWEKHPIKKYFEADLTIIKNHIHEDFFINKPSLSLPENHIKKLENYAHTHLNHDAGLLKIINRIRLKSIQELIEPHFRASKYLAERNEKIITTTYIGDAILVDPKHYKDLFLSFTHLFRNALDHGIETIEERLLKNKSRKGHLSFSAQIQNGWIYLVFEDDGKGVRLDAVQAKARERELIDEKTMSHMDETAIMHLIFEDGFSSLDNCTNYSGRGVGLSAVREEVQKLRGHISVESEPEKFTRIKMKLPFNR